MNDNNDEMRPDVDVMLGEFFQAEMPAPWPTLQISQGVRPRRVTSFWSRTSGRLALAACVAALVASYIALSGYFPRRAADSGIQDVHHVGQGHQKGPVEKKND